MQESNRLEFKLKLNDKFEREVVAFLNYHEGGDIYIGMDNNGNVVGVDNPDETQLIIADRIKNNILPATLGLFDIAPEKHGDKTVIHVIVSSGSEKPYYLKRAGMSSRGCFIRIGSSSQPMETSMIDDLYSRRTRNSLSRIESPRRNLEFEQLQIYYQSKGLKLNDKFPETLDLLTPHGEFNYVAYLLADENGTSVKVAKYAGTNKVDLIENEEYGYCSLIKATKSVLNKFEIENKTFAKITSKERIEQKLVDPIALREAVINAVVHNDYTSEVPPLFEIFSDRIQITSYGGLPTGLSKEDFFNCRSMSRNRELMRVFKDVGLVEQLGSGMSRILEAYDKSIFEITDNFMIVTFKFPEKAAINQKSGDKLEKVAIKSGDNTKKVAINQKSGDKKISKRYEEQKELVINYLTQHEFAKSDEFVDILGVKISRVKIILSRMVDDGYIVADGSNRNRTYRLK